MFVKKGVFWAIAASFLLCLAGGAFGWGVAPGSRAAAENIPQAGAGGDTVATAAVTPNSRQVFYLWEEDNVPAQTEYSVNNGGYFAGVR